jgi:hypothetical protein
MTRVNEKYQRIGYALVRDRATGKPKVDNPADLHPMHFMMMTAAERADLGGHADCWARDAQGYKRLTKTGTGRYQAAEALVAVSEVFDVHTGDVWRLARRSDAPEGAVIHVENADR